MNNRYRHSFVAALVLACTVTASPAAEAWKPAPAPLMTPWARDVSPTNPLPEYPRPQMTRRAWQSLNGLWDTALTAPDAASPTNYEGQILVPYPWESALSGVGRKSIPDQRLWCRRSFTIPKDWKGQNVLLHFGAVNYDSTVFVNGRQVGAHRGGFDAFSFDITEFLKPGANELVVSAWNPVRADAEDAQVIGKQRLNPGGIFYTAATGIWQPAWLEPVPAKRIAALKMVPDIDAKVLYMAVQTEHAAGLTAVVEAFDGETPVATVGARTGREIVLPVATPHLWTPDDPFLYRLRVTLLLGSEVVDQVESYFAMRKVSLGKDEQGRTKIFLNNQFLLQVGALDQGYWPDGIFTAPTDTALRFDIDMAKELGWNLLRKHAKVEPARWYYHCDRLGMLVWQDMPQMYGGREGALSDTAKKQFELEWRRIISQFFNHPSIIVWTTFNEAWGQHDTDRVVALTKELDPTRLVNNASGWTDKKVGDIHDTHAYPGPWAEMPESNRASVNGEFGGVTMSIPGHRWNDQVMGYGAVLKNSWIVTKRFQNLMKTAYRIAEERGISAFVYTQITDVEQEINGLLTYDRTLVKMDKKIVTAANKGEFLPLPPNPNPELVPTSAEEPATWRYTTEQPAEGWEKPGFVDGAWQSGPAGFGNDASNVRTSWKTSDIWIRREFTLPETIPAKLVLLVQHDEGAEIYLNGVLAGRVTGFKGEYAEVEMSAEARATLKPGVNTLAAHCKNTTGGQSIDVGITEAGK